MTRRYYTDLSGQPLWMEEVDTNIERFIVRSPNQVLLDKSQIRARPRSSF